MTDRAELAVIHACEATDASARVKHQLRLAVECLRRVAVGTAQRAAFEDDGRPDARAVAPGAVRDSKDVPRHGKQIIMAFSLTPQQTERRRPAPQPGPAAGRRCRTKEQIIVKNVCWALIGLAGLAFVIGTGLAFTKATFLLEPVGFWRGAVGMLVFAIALRLMDDVRR
jgi:hypothetical protein